MESIQYIWKDRKRILGMPITFTRYRLSEDRLFCEKGFLNIKQDEVLLYRVRDLQLNMSLGQRLTWTGVIVNKAPSAWSPPIRAFPIWIL